MQPDYNPNDQVDKGRLIARYVCVTHTAQSYQRAKHSYVYWRNRQSSKGAKYLSLEE